MIQNCRTTFRKCLDLKNFIAFEVRLLNTTPINCLDQRWRAQRGLPMNPNSHGVLTDAPDYTYLDGRSVPYGVRQRKRILKEKEIAEKIISLSKEVDFAVERHKLLQAEEENRKKEILANKLKPKGKLLLRKSTLDTSNSK